MKACVFCKEQIQEDAVKCRFCHSMLLPVQGGDAGVPESKSVTYVVDRDLVRFGKFAGAVLGIFLIVGAYLFGFKLDAALEQVHGTQKELAESHEKLLSAQTDLTNALNTVRNLKHQVESVLAEAQQTLGEISEQKVLAVAQLESMRTLTLPQLLQLQEVKAQEPRKFRRDSSGHYWINGSTLRLKFLDGDSINRAKILSLAQRWLDHANLKIQPVIDGEAEIRVSFKQPGAWSFVGTDALIVPQDQPTMNFDSVEQSGVLSTWGHALGLISELQNPSAHIPWNKDLVYQELASPPYTWSRETIDANVFHTVPIEKLGDYRQFDPRSIMTMSVPKEWVRGMAIGGNGNLSESDKALIARIYPKIH